MMCYVKNYQSKRVKEWAEDFDARKMEQFVWIPM